MTAGFSSDFFVSTAWLADQLGAPDLAIVDASFFMPAENRDARAEYRAGHIPGAVFFDVDAIADHSTNLPHMLPSPPDFAGAAGRLGLGDGMRIVVYDASGLVGAARVWWTLRLFGATDVKLLEGGLQQWRAEGRPLEAGEREPAARVFTPRFDAAGVAAAADVLRASETGVAQIVDARSAGRFSGDVAEPRPGPALRPHSGKPQCAVGRGRGGRTPEARRRGRRRLRQGRRRSRQADHHDLRLRRNRGDPAARP